MVRHFHSGFTSNLKREECHYTDLAERRNKLRKIYYQVQGGLGLNISFASFISLVKREFPGEYWFAVNSPYYDIFEACPDVDQVYKGPELADLIFDCKEDGGELYVGRIYDTQGFIFKQDNYHSAWAKQLNIPLPETEQMIGYPYLKPFDKYPNLKTMVENLKKLIDEKGFEDYAIMQFTGGQSPLVQVPPKKDPNGNPLPEPDWNAVPYQYENEPLKRHYPMDKAQKFVDLYHEKFPNRAILIYQLPNEPGPDGDFIFRATMPYLSWYELAKDASDIVAIDSSLQHLAVAPGRRMTVIWGHSLPEHFGYSYNNNIIQKCRRDNLLYFTALGPCGAKIQYIEPEELLKEVIDE